MKLFEGGYCVTVYSRHSNASLGRAVAWQARVDICHWTDKSPAHVIYEKKWYPTSEAAKAEALSDGVRWARANPWRATHSDRR